MKKWIKIFVLGFILFSEISVFNLNAQQITWQKILNNNSGLFYKTQQTADGGYVAVGTDGVDGITKIYLSKFDLYGNTLWKRLIGGNSCYDGFWVEQTKDNGFIIAGDGDGPNIDGVIIKTDNYGIVQWQKNYGGNDLDQAYCVKQTFDNGYILALRTTSFSSTNDIMIVKTDSLGNLSWQKIFDKNADEVPSEICLVGNYGYIISGTSSLPGQYAFAYILRLNLNGDTLWTRLFSIESVTTGNSISNTSDGSFIIGGGSKANTSVDEKSYVIKIDSNGIIQWQRTYTDPGSEEECKSIREIPNRGYVLAGSSDTSYIVFSVKAYIRIISFSGEVLNLKYYNPGDDDDLFYSVENTSDGGFILAGVSAIRGQHSKMYIVKADSLGFAQPVEVINNSEYILNDYNLYQNYPNPFNLSTIIKYHIPRKTKIGIIIFDELGKVISNLIDREQESGTYEINFNPDNLNLSSGVYFVKLLFNNQNYFSITRSIVYLK